MGIATKEAWRDSEKSCGDGKMGMATKEAQEDLGEGPKDFEKGDGVQEEASTAGARKPFCDRWDLSSP
eukprot:4516206-Karenia_brevis.AAC.1